jgi:truncated hemoglobin YjbI
MTPRAPMASADALDLYQLAGGRRGCLQLSEAFYARVALDPVLKPLFPGKTMRCAIEAFAAFLAQFLGGPSEDAQQRWWLSLRESHQRYKIGAREREAWMRNMVAALDEVSLDGAVRDALRDLFEGSSAYIVNTGQRPSAAAPAKGSSSEPVHRALEERWTEQQSLDALVAAIREADAVRSLELIASLQARLAIDRAVFVHLLMLMMGQNICFDYVRSELQADPALAHLPSRYGRTLLHEAAGCGSLPIIELLLRLDADPNVRTSGGHTPLYCLANECQGPAGASIVRALVGAGAQVDARSDSKQSTPLHMAARRGNSEVAAALLDYGANIHAQDSDGDTPLRRAHKCRKPQLVHLLIARGADPHPAASLRWAPSRIDQVAD